MKAIDQFHGPWEFEARHEAIRTIPALGRPYGAVVARVGNHPGFVERKNIGPLLAAAPNLLDVARIAERFISGFEDDQLHEGIGEMLATIREAIAMAQGEVA